MSSYWDGELLLSKKCVGLDRKSWKPGPARSTSPHPRISFSANWPGGKWEVEPRQWNDLLEVLKKQASTLERDYLQRSAPLAGVADLLAQVLHDAGLPPL
jgi:hypothetical protein